MILMINKNISNKVCFVFLDDICISSHIANHFEESKQNVFHFMYLSHAYKWKYSMQRIIQWWWTISQTLFTILLLIYRSSTCNIFLSSMKWMDFANMYGILFKAQSHSNNNLNTFNIQISSMHKTYSKMYIIKSWLFLFIKFFFVIMDPYFNIFLL